MQGTQVRAADSCTECRGIGVIGGIFAAQSLVLNVRYPSRPIKALEPRSRNPTCSGIRENVPDNVPAPA